MTSTSRRIAAFSQTPSSEDDWKDLIAWDDELYDPLFQSEAGIAGTSSGTVYGDSFTSAALDSVNLEQAYVPSAPTSVYCGPESFDYVLSRPASVAEGSPSFDHGHSWLGTSPSYTTSATSPLIAQAGLPCHGSFEASETMLSPR